MQFVGRVGSAANMQIPFSGYRHHHASLRGTQSIELCCCEGGICVVVRAMLSAL